MLIRDSSSGGAVASDAVSVALKHPAVKALLSVVEGEPAPKTLADLDGAVVVDMMEKRVDPSDGGAYTRQSFLEVYGQRAYMSVWDKAQAVVPAAGGPDVIRRQANGRRAAGAGETGGARRPRKGPRDGTRGPAAAGRRRGSSGGQPRSPVPQQQLEEERRGVPGAEPGWLRGTTRAPVPEPASGHALDDLTAAFGGGQPGDRGSPASLGAMDARTRLLRGRPRRR